MHEESKEVVEEIRTHRVAIGTLSKEALKSAKDDRFMAETPRSLTSWCLKAEHPNNPENRQVVRRSNGGFIKII